MKRIVAQTLVLAIMVSLAYSALGQPQTSSWICGHKSGLETRGNLNFNLGQYNLVSVSLEPSVLSLAGGNCRLEIKVDTNTIKEILVVDPPPFNIITPGPDTLHLKDDGTNGDILANDQTFTYGPINIGGDESFPGSKYYRSDNLIIQFIYKSGQKNKYSVLPITYGLRQMPVYYQDPKVIKISPSAQYTEYVLNIVTESHSLEPKVFAQYYKYLPDDRDFLVLSTTHPTEARGISVGANCCIIGGYFTSVTSNTKGIYSNNLRSHYDDSKLYGSKGKLLGTVSCYSTFDAQFDFLVHELNHYWSSFLDPSFEISDDFGHYETGFFTTSGFLGHDPSQIERMSDTQLFVKWGTTSNNFSHLELYLAGLIPLDSVPFPLISYLNTSFIKTDNQGSYYNYQNTKITTKTQFITAMGPRTPSYKEAQKTFRVGLIVTSPRLLTPSELAHFHHLMRENEEEAPPPNYSSCTHKSPSADYYFCLNNFYRATGGRGRLITKITDLNQTTSIESINYSQVTVYPNPAHDRLYLDVQQELAGPLYFTLYDLTGRKLQQGWWPAGESLRLTIAYHGLAFITLRDQKTQKIFTEKIYVQRR